MINVSNDFKNLCKEFATQKCVGQIVKGDSVIEFTDEDIDINGLEVDEASQSSGVLELGSVIANQMDIVFVNKEKFANADLLGSEVNVAVFIEDNLRAGSISLAGYTIDNVEVYNDKVKVTAFDRMLAFDKKADVEYPTSVENLVNKCCTDCGVVAPDFAGLPNRTYVVHKPMVDGLTYRQLLSWCCQILGVCAYIYSNILHLKWYTDTTEEINGDVRFEGTINDSEITISGVHIKDVKNTQDNGSYSLDLSSNLLIQDNQENVLQGIFDHVSAKTSYTPFSATIIPMLWLSPLDIVKVVDKDGNETTGYVTNYHYVFNGKNIIESQGESTLPEVDYSEGVQEQVSKTKFTAEQIVAGKIQSVNQDVSAGDTFEIDLDDAKITAIGKDGNSKISLSEGGLKLWLDDETQIPLGALTTDDGLMYLTCASAIILYGLFGVGVKSQQFGINANTVYISDPENDYLPIWGIERSKIPWRAVELASGITANPTYGCAETPVYRMIGDRVEIAGTVNVTWTGGSNNIVLGTIAEDYRPSSVYVFEAPAGNRRYVAHLIVDTDGQIVLQAIINRATGADVTSKTFVQLNTSYIIGAVTTDATR